MNIEVAYAIDLPNQTLVIGCYHNDRLSSKFAMGHAFPFSKPPIEQFTHFFEDSGEKPLGKTCLENIFTTIEDRLKEKKIFMSTITHIIFYGDVNLYSPSAPQVADVFIEKIIPTFFKEQTVSMILQSGNIDVIQSTRTKLKLDTDNPLLTGVDIIKKGGMKLPPTPVSLSPSNVSITSNVSMKSRQSVWSFDISKCENSSLEGLPSISPRIGGYEQSESPESITNTNAPQLCEALSAAAGSHTPNIESMAKVVTNALGKRGFSIWVSPPNLPSDEQSPRSPKSPRLGMKHSE